jgi:hypothetical protein
MEFRVYDGASKRVGPILSAGLAAGMLAAFSALLLTAQGAARMRNGVFLVLLFPAAIILALSAALSVMMSVRIRIERMTGEVLRRYAVFGLDVSRQRFRLSDFDRISLNRNLRAGYRVSLVGREEDLTIFFSAKLGTAREQADKVAAECGLKLSDQL